MVEHNMEAYYRARAPEYEQIYYRDDAARRSAIDAEANRLTALVAGKDVLELACGTGYWTEVMSRTARSIVASDVSPEMIAQARRKRCQCPVTFVAADMFAADFGARQFALVALGFWYSHQPKQEFEALYRVLDRPLKPAGLIWMIDNNPPAEGPINESVGRDEFGNNFKRRRLDNGGEYVILKNYFSQEDLEELLGRRYRLESLVYGQHYWSVVMGLRPSSPR
jgi:demethylmenaquinone methyltransferase/2-methoxy-6-polyprenyl-1,4-benzoquinol methylase